MVMMSSYLDFNGLTALVWKYYFQKTSVSDVGGVEFGSI